MEPFPRPERSEAAEYYFNYIDQVPAGDIREVLAAQSSDLQPLFESISEERSLHRYAPGKWSMRELLGHVNDTERVFTFRAFWFARGFAEPLPAFDQEIAVPAAVSDSISWAEHIAEFRAIRSATLCLFRNLPEAAWLRSGIASDNPVTVRALAYITAGHAAHHLAILRERYQ